MGERVLQTSKELVGNGANLLRIAELAVERSDGRLRIVYNEEAETEEFDDSAQRFLKLDDKRLGRDIELYDWMGSDLIGWGQTLPTFLSEVLGQFAEDLPESYAIASEELKKLGETIYKGKLLDKWRKLFQEPSS